jgi:glucose uptake protein GlcU
VIPLSDYYGLLWIVAAGLLFGSQFVPSKYCPQFRSGAYNISMALGILAGSMVTALALGIHGLAPGMFVLAFLGGMTWVVGNYLLIEAVASAGIARSFVMINFTAVLSFIGGVYFLGELGDVTLPGLAMISAAIGLVILGSFIVTTTIPKKDGRHFGTDGMAIKKGLAAAFLATVFFSVYNVMIGYVINSAGISASTAFISITPGIVLGAVVVAALARGNGLGDWKAAPAKWHMLALVQGFIWAAAMMCIMFGWMGTGIAMATPVQVGTQTLASSLWGLAVFGEFRGLEKRGAAYARLAAGAAVTVAGILMMASI